jgi:hypothetical protein
MVMGVSDITRPPRGSAGSAFGHVPAQSPLVTMLASPPHQPRRSSQALARDCVDDVGHGRVEADTGNAQLRRASDSSIRISRRPTSARMKVRKILRA